MNSTIFPKTAQAIKEDTYVDDCLTGAVAEEAAFALYDNLVEMMKMGGFDLVKWATNSKALLVRIPNDQKIPNRYVCLDFLQ